MRTLVVLVFCTLICACSYHQRNSHRVVSVTPESSTVSVAKHFQYSQQAYGGTYDLDPKLSAYVNRLAQKACQNSLVPSSSATVVVVNSSIPNIWSFAGGHIAITRGLLCELQNEAELMAVICHEISHMQNEHTGEKIQKVILNAGPVKLDVHHNYYVSDFSVGPLGSGSGLVTLKYDSESEIHADELAVAQMQQMGYAPSAIVDLQRRIHVYQKSGEPSWVGGYLAKHPITELQLDKCQNCQKGLADGGRLNQDNFASHMAQLHSQARAYQKLDEGYSALLKQKYEQAISIAQTGIEMEPNEAHFYLLKGKAQARLGHFVPALSSFNMAIATNPYYFDHYLQRGLVKEQLDDWAEASLDLERSLTLLPTAEAYYALGEIDYNKERQAEAIEYFRKASISGSPGGKKATARLKGLGLPLSGLQTLKVHPTFTDSGHLDLSVKNTGSSTARCIVVDVEQIDPSGNLISRHFIEIKKDLDPQESIQQKTNIGPFFSKSHMKKSLRLYAVYCE